MEPNAGRPAPACLRARGPGGGADPRRSVRRLAVISRLGPAPRLRPRVRRIRTAGPRSRPPRTGGGRTRAGRRSRTRGPREPAALGRAASREGRWNRGSRGRRGQGRTLLPWSGSRRRAPTPDAGPHPNRSHREWRRPALRSAPPRRPQMIGSRSPLLRLARLLARTAAEPLRDGRPRRRLGSAAPDELPRERRSNAGEVVRLSCHCEIPTQTGATSTHGRVGGEPVGGVL